MARVNPIFKSPLINNPVRNGGGASYFPPSNPKPKPKVVSIPVRFFGSETTSKKKIDPSVAAMKIQSIFRGFLVRKNAKIVREIEAEVDEIENKFGPDREMDLIVGDPRERLRISEMLMRLLFRLDSVRGVRDYRKWVIRRVILIQEMLDSISAAESVGRKRSEDESMKGTLETPQDEKPDQEMVDLISAVGSDDRNQLKVDPVTLAIGSDDQNQLKVDADIDEGETPWNDKPDQEMNEGLKPDPEIEDAETPGTRADHEMVYVLSALESPEQKLGTGDHDLDAMESKVDGATEVAKTVESELDQEMEDSVLTFESTDQNLESADSMKIPQGSEPKVKDAEVKTPEHDDEPLKTEDLKPENEDQISTGWELLEAQEANDPLPVNQESVIVEEGEEDNKATVMKESENEKLKEVMERMVAENEKLKGLVVELCQRSAQQCRLMGGLAERVEHLEKVVQKMEKMNKKKRKDGASLPAFTVDKKCGGNRTS